MDYGHTQRCTDICGGQVLNQMSDEEPYDRTSSDIIMQKVK